MNHAPVPNPPIPSRPPLGRPGRPTIRTTFQHISDVELRDRDVQRTFESAIDLSLRWLQMRFPHALPRQSNDRQSFPLEIPGQKIECVALPEKGIWCARLDQLDAPYRGRPAVPGRTWTTDISFVRRADSVGFGIRVFCASLPYATEEIALTRPRLVGDIATRLGLREGRALVPAPWIIATEEDLASLLDFLKNPSRTLPVVVLTQPEARPVPVADYVLNAIDLAARAHAHAHIVQLPRVLGFKWSEMVGKPWSVYRGAVRTYMPSLDFDRDPLGGHPLTILDSILFYKYKDLTAERAFETFLMDRLAIYSATKRVQWADRLFVTDARTLAAEASTQRLQSALRASKATEETVASLRGQIEQMQQAHTTEVAALYAKIAELHKEAEVFNDDAMQAGRDREHYATENDRLRGHIAALRISLEAKNGESIDSAVTIPESLEDLPEWVGRHLVGRLELHSRALTGLKAPVYEEPGLVYRALLALANEYRNMRIGCGTKEAFQAKMDALHLRCSGSISESRAGEEGETYFVRYPVGIGQRRFLELHIRSGGNTRDPSRCLAIYFFWDDESQQVVVGWLPSHLDNRAT